MSIDPKDIEVGNRYLCVFPNDNILRDYFVVEISPMNLQNKRYVKLRYDLENRWVALDALSGSVIEKLEEEAGNKGCVEFIDENDKSCIVPVQNFETKREESNELQNFMKLQSEYLKILIKEKKDTDNWKE